MNHSSFTRIYKIDEMIRFGRFRSVKQVAEELEISQRSIDRDLEKMRYELGADIEYNRRAQRYEYAGNAITLPGQWLDKNEMAIILIAEKALRMYTHTGFADEVHPAFNHFLDPVRSKKDVMEHIKELCKSVYFYRSFEPIRGLRREFSIVLAAIMENKRLSIEYLSSKSDLGKRRQIEPYTLINNNGVWQVVGRCLRERRIKTFALDSIFDPIVEDFYFSVPEKYNPFDYFHHQFETLKKKNPVDIKLRISFPSSSYIKEILWHPTQKIKENRDRSVILTMKCNITDYLIKWILQMSEDVVILQPDDLKNSIVKKIERMLEKNKKS